MACCRVGSSGFSSGGGCDERRRAVQDRATAGCLGGRRSIKNNKSGGTPIMVARWRGLRNSLVLIVTLVAIWQGLYWWVGDIALASPLATFAYTAKLFASESFGTHVIDTLRAFAIAYALSVVIGLVVGFWLGFDRLSGDTLEPMIVSVYAVPKNTLYPILLLAFGLTLSAKVAFGVLHGVIPIILFTLAAVHNTKPILI